MEIFKEIEGGNGLYQIGNLGTVKSFKRKPTINVKLFNHSQGYLMFSVCFKSKHKYLFHHREMAKAFIPNPLNKRCINHKNGIKNDNRLENLEWATHSENMTHALDTKLNKSEKPVAQISLDGFIINEFRSHQEASRQTGVLQHNITRVVNGQRKKAGGYIWK